MKPLLTTLIALMAGLIPALAQPIGSSAETSPPTVVIWFGFDDATVRPDFSDNRHSLAQLDSLLHERNFTLLDTLRIVGKSSMDGVYAYNAQLATRRARAVRSYILKHYPDFQGTLSVLSEGEVWAEFREAVAQDSSLPEGTRERMLGIIDSDASPDRKEARLKSLPTWRSYMRALFPTYRSATVTPYYWMLDLPRLPEDEMLKSLSWLPRTPAVQLRPDLLTVPALTPVRKRAKGPIRPVFGLSTNLLYDLTYIPNYGLTSIPSFSLEYYPARSRHLTLGTDVEWPMWKHWEDHRFLQIQNVTLWMRRYFKSCDERFHGMYLFASANAARFGIGYDAKGWEGEGVGASLGIGCKWTLGRRLFLDLGIAGGAFYAQYDPYVYGNDATHRYYYDYTGAPEEFVVRNHRWLWGGPTRAYLSLGIDLFNRKRRSR